MRRTTAGIALGVAGLFMFNVICGPFAIALGAVGFHRAAGPRTRWTAALSVLLGVADLVILAVLVASKVHSGAFDWRLN